MINRTMGLNKGFTLMEILIALFIFAIISAIIMSSVFIYIKTQETISIKAKELGDTQRAMLIISHDVRQLINRQAKGSDGINQPSLLVHSGTEQPLTLTRMGFVNPYSKYRRSTLQRVVYLVEQDSLIRRTWSNIDYIADDNYQDEVLLKGISGFVIEIFTGQNYLEDYRQNRRQSFPAALIISFQVKGLGEVRRVFKLTG